MLDRITQGMRKRLPAAGIIEIIIAMLLIAMIMGVSSVLYSRLMNHSKGMLQIKAELAAKELYAHTVEKQTFINEEGVLHDLHYTKEMLPAHGDSPGVYHVRITLYNVNGDFIYQLNELHRIDF